MKTLDYFTKSDRQDTVSVGVASDGLTGVLMTSDATLTAAAVAAGKSTWDEDTICSVLGIQRKPAPVEAQPE